MGKGILLSPKHGVNPTMGVCAWCGQDDGTLALLGRLKGDKEAPRRCVLTQEPCAACKEKQAKGITLFSLEDDGLRVHQWVVVKEAAITESPLPKEVQEGILKRRMARLAPEVLERIAPPAKKEGV